MAKDAVMADKDTLPVKVVAVTVAVIRMIKHENVVEWGAADEVVLSLHLQSSLLSSHSPPLPLLSMHLQLLLISVHLSLGLGAAGVGDAMKAADVCDAVLKTVVLAGTGTSWTRRRWQT
jgi:hypothetical protein